MARKYRKMKKGTVKQVAAPQVIDYTTIPVGTVTMQWTYKDKDGKNTTGKMTVEKCPKCGRNGEKQRRIFKQKDGSLKEVCCTYTHRSRIDRIIPGFPLTVIEDQCEVPTEETK